MYGFRLEVSVSVYHHSSSRERGSVRSKKRLLGIRRGKRLPQRAAEALGVHLRRRYIGLVSITSRKRDLKLQTKSRRGAWPLAHPWRGEQHGVASSHRVRCASEYAHILPRKAQPSRVRVCVCRSARLRSTISQGLRLDTCR